MSLCLNERGKKMTTPCSAKHSNTTPSSRNTCPLLDLGKSTLSPPKNLNKTLLKVKRKCYFTFREFCSIPMGKSWMGLVVIHKRNLGLGLVIFSKHFSSSFSHFTIRWQFCSINHWPMDAALSRNCSATFITGTEDNCPQCLYFLMLISMPAYVILVYV